MTLRALHRWRQMAVGFALLGVLFHATVLHWHAAQRFAASFSEAQLAADLTAICHSNGTGVTVADQGDLPAPSDQQRECLICKGLSALHLAILVLVPRGLIEPLPEHVARISSDDFRDGTEAITPKSRGPPLPV